LSSTALGSTYLLRISVLGNPKLTTNIILNREKKASGMVVQGLILSPVSILYLKTFKEVDLWF
jgi:hypothetical protein